MPCKIKIKQHVENLVDQKSQPGLSMSLQDAQILSANINSEFMHHVVSFKNDNGVIKRDINIPSPLVDMYYDLQVKKEIVNIPTTEIKSGVEELFESNPELADVVYETAGLKTKTSENEILRNVKETLSFPGNYNNIDDGLIGRRVYEETIDGDIYKFEISNYSYENEDGTYESFYDIDFTVNGSEELVGSGFFNKSERGKQIIQALLSVNYGNDTVRFNVEESNKGKQRLTLYKRLMSQLGYNPSNEMEYALFYNVKTDKVNLTPQQKQQAQQLYSQYLDTIFPDSKVKDIVYRGAEKNIENHRAYSHWTLRKVLAENFSKQGVNLNKKEESNNTVYSALLNIRNLVRTIEITDKSLKDKGFDSAASFPNQQKADGTYYDNKEANESIQLIDKNLNNEITVFEPEQIHILGNKQDIEGFKQFNNNKQDVRGLNSDINSLNLTPEVVNYLYRSSRSKSKNVSLDSYTKEVKKLIDNLRTSYTNEEILEKIKCL